MDCTVCDLPFVWEDGVQLESSTPFPQVGIKQAYVPAASSPHLAYKLVPCLHIICLKCYEAMCDYTKTCPFPYCFSLLRLNPDMRLNKCESPTCRRRVSAVGELIELDCQQHSLCGECHGELFRGRHAALCPQCGKPLAAEGEESCDVCAKFGPAEKMATAACCEAKICPACAERGKKERAAKDATKEDVRCPEGKCPPKKRKKRSREEPENTNGAAHVCSCGIECTNEPLPNFPSEGECDHEVCVECLGKTLEANEKSKLVPCCPSELCRAPYRSESVLPRGYFDMFEVGYHFGFEKLKDEKILEVVDVDDGDFNKRLFTIKAVNSEAEDDVVSIDFDRKGSFGDLLREVRKALKIGVTDKVYGYYLRIDGEDRVIVITQKMIQQDVTTAGVLRATMVMVDMSGIVSANRHVANN
ncbi:hypothetical protein PRIPAC_86541 [Pristionchus pacificus]|uniref:Uncharacterized protein n=1 Tax=Pristionchus pacificus TaxID=54126 RepID=A0A2A6BSH4_PRIPA|nr:hypothetical protein PRIPAC_86541 [Pristionchus pacificus]|eukprot:PDM68850.1 hypothetical protein PRIPAC_47152 [Pristionchus pacificus]